MNKELWFVRDCKTQDLSRKIKMLLIVWKVVDSLFFKTSISILNPWSVFLLRLFGAKIGKGCYVAQHATILMPWNLIMGNHSSLDDYVYIKNTILVELEDFVSIGVFTHIVPDGHDVRTRNFASVRTPVKIRHGAFIGADCFIFGGVEIGQFAVVGAKTSVFKNVEENTIVYGTPCTVHGTRIPTEQYVQYRYSL